MSTYLYSPKKKVFQIVVKLMDTPGSLGAVLSLLGGRVNLVGTTSHALDDGTAIMSAFAETISPSETAEKLSALIKSSHVAMDNQVTESSEGLLVDTFHTGVENSHGIPMVLISREGVAHMFDGLNKIFGSGGEFLLYREGFFVGESNAARTAGVLGPGLAKKKVGDLMYLFSARGWGQAKWKGDAESKEQIVTVEDCFECSSGEGIKTGCGFMRGYLDGWAKSILGREVKCVETRCRFKGDDACEFTLNPGPK